MLWLSQIKHFHTRYEGRGHALVFHFTFNLFRGMVVQSFVDAKWTEDANSAWIIQSFNTTHMIAVLKRLEKCACTGEKQPLVLYCSSALVRGGQYKFDMVCSVLRQVREMALEKHSSLPCLYIVNKISNPFSVFHYVTKRNSISLHFAFHVNQKVKHGHQ